MAIHLSIDIETRSSVDLAKSGTFKYINSPDFEILLFAYKLGYEEVRIVDLKNGEKIPIEIIRALRDNNYKKHAYNAAFEWACLNKAGYKTNIWAWECTMAHALYLGLPSGLLNTGTALGLSSSVLKDKKGTALINFFCKPQKETKKNGGKVWNEPIDDMTKWEEFKEYCKQDVMAEFSILQALNNFDYPFLQKVGWIMDTERNDIGAMVDIDFVNAAIEMHKLESGTLEEQARLITRLDNPNSPKQLIEWLNSQGVETDSISREKVEEILKTDCDLKVKKVLNIRQKLAKTSVKKYEAMVSSMVSINAHMGQIKGLLQFYGANRTGRWAGRLVQIQNLPRNYIKFLDSARALVKAKNINALRMLRADINDILSQLIRTAFIPRDGNKFIISDFSAIEARVIAWLANQEWVNEVFKTHGKIYEATAANMFNVPIELIKKGNKEYELRQKGKVATLALGYQGGVNALIAMGALNMGIKEEELTDIVTRWRQSNDKIVQLWHDVENCAIYTIINKKECTTNGLIFRWEESEDINFLSIQLPSKRRLYYARPRVDDWGKIYFYNTSQTTKAFVETSAYGGKLVENIVQGIARDCLESKLRTLDFKGYKTVFHIHDEVVIDCDCSVTVEEINEILDAPIHWADGLVLKSAGFESKYYMKD